MKKIALVPGEFKVLANHIYEFKKGVRNLVLYTLDVKYAEMACQRLESQEIPYLKQEVNGQNVNLYFGEPACLNVIKSFINRPLNQLTPEEDFILGALLGYDICKQCTRFCERKQRCNKENSLSEIA
jgi:hypothetical protein